MAFAHSHLSYRGGEKPKGGFHVDLSFARHFVGIFALTFSASVLFAIGHFLFRI